MGSCMLYLKGNERKSSHMSQVYKLLIVVIHYYSSVSHSIKRYRQYFYKLQYQRKKQLNIAFMIKKKMKS